MTISWWNEPQVILFVTRDLVVAMLGTCFVVYFQEELYS